jgi:dTDP-glucose 4,6-dehydratase
MDKILVTGGAGFIGSCFVRSWIDKQPGDVVDLDLLTYAGNLESVSDHSRQTFIEGDIRDQQLVKELLAQHRPQALIHFAAESHVDRSIERPADFVSTNVLGTSVLLQAALEYWQELILAEKESFRFLHISTDEVYGSIERGQKVVEGDPYAPNSPYAASKAAADHLVRAYHHTYGLPTLITHSSNNYGPYQFPEKFIPLLIVKALEEKPLPLYGAGQQVRDWIFVEDHCLALQELLHRGTPGQVYHIGGGCERTNLQVAETLCEILDRLNPNFAGTASRRLITFVEDRPGHDRRYGLDSTKIMRELGWEPSGTFEHQLETTIGWYLNHSDWVERVCRGKYGGERLGLADS